MTNQIYLFLFLVVFLAIPVLFRSYLLWKSTGINAFTFDNTKDDAHSFNGQVFKMITILELIIVIIYSFGGDAAQYLLPFWYLENSMASLIGWVFMHIALIWIIVAQLQMSDAWRIGIDYKNETDLIQYGLFSISRNPIFFGIIITNIGLFLVVPNAFTLVITILSTYAINIQIRLEEVYLQESHTDNYSEYSSKVRRWL